MDKPDTAKQSVRVTIFNQAYTVSTSGDPQRTEELAREVDELMSAIARRAGNLDTTRTAVLACLHLADRLRAAQQELGILKERVADKTQSFTRLLDQAFSSYQSE